MLWSFLKDTNRPLSSGVQCLCWGDLRTFTTMDLLTLAPRPQTCKFVLLGQGCSLIIQNVPQNRHFQVLYPTFSLHVKNKSMDLSCFISMHFVISTFCLFFAFLDEGVVDCVETIKQGDTYFTTVFNNGSVDYSNYYRFSCLVRLESFYEKLFTFLL